MGASKLKEENEELHVDQSLEGLNSQVMLEVDTNKVSSEVLGRIIDEVRNEAEAGSTQLYNRTYHRHNR